MIWLVELIGRTMGAIAGLQEHLKLARDYALEGMYESSIIFFDGAIAQINKYVTIVFQILSVFNGCNIISFGSLLHVI